ncbi:hypothetical protein BBBOND_0406080 [Babesia bigemina]|uniref:Uncharacterized protein n=1 Tax=Babesia bigemina TaxID=5866 RepID=A0A061DEB3_BABBI|nr:hypothetical protein BBBOND_0406080 [Babesia bigemina]CDR98124.1 hypothetical protein BBBOND_0406080 [Babesia bigemina]|eukprot:XP_012770310.1 hypothetical protein BBBOND_0406080 [Babesia bigemina]
MLLAFLLSLWIPTVHHICSELNSYNTYYIPIMSTQVTATVLCLFCAFVSLFIANIAIAWYLAYWMNYKLDFVLNYVGNACFFVGCACFVVIPFLTPPPVADISKSA